MTVPEGCADNGGSTGLPLMQPTKRFLRLPPPTLGAAVLFVRVEEAMFAKMVVVDGLATPQLDRIGDADLR